MNQLRHTEKNIRPASGRKLKINVVFRVNSGKDEADRVLHMCQPLSVFVNVDVYMVAIAVELFLLNQLFS